MAENSKIEWTDHTFNPWIGCTKVSEGCKFCYAETLMDHRYGKVEWGPQGERKRTSDSYWRQPLKWNREAEAQGIRRKVFCASLADVFEDRRGQDALTLWRAQLWQLIEQTPNLDWLLLTKRPENVNDMVPAQWRNVGKWPVNVWIGTSVEDQKRADERIPHLLQIPAVVRFLSCEPLLGPIDIGRSIPCGYYCDGNFHVDHPFWTYGIASPIHWIICGGESGPHARPMHPDWARRLRDQCAAAGVPYFFKQWGEYVPVDQFDTSGYDDVKMAENGATVYPDGMPYISGTGNAPIGYGAADMWRVGKRAAGRLLDGREWSEWPQGAAVMEGA